MRNLLTLIIVLVAVFQIKTWLDNSDLYFKLDRLTEACTIDMIQNDNIYCD